MSDKPTLHQAMIEVLKDCQGRTATFKYVAYEIASRRLYFQKSGNEAPQSQIRLRARRYPKLFEILPPDKVKLK